MERATLLAIHTVARPEDPNESIPRQEMAARTKFLAEAGSEELKMILGWLLNFRTLTTNLPENKFIAWSSALRKLIDKGEAQTKELEKNIGRMIHVAQILPEISHFLNRLQGLHRRAKLRRKIKVPKRCKDNIELLLRFLKKAKDGIDMNSIAYLLPKRVYRSDSGPHGLGGYSDQGYAWRWYVPDELLYRATNNLLEHLAVIITAWIDILVRRLKPGDCALSLTDSLTTNGWSFKSNFDKDPLDKSIDPIEAEVRAEVCRHFAILCIENEIQSRNQKVPWKRKRRVRCSLEGL